MQDCSRSGSIVCSCASSPVRHWSLVIDQRSRFRRNPVLERDHLVLDLVEIFDQAGLQQGRDYTSVYTALRWPQGARLGSQAGSLWVTRTQNLSTKSMHYIALMVGAGRFELPTPCSRSSRALCPLPNEIMRGKPRCAGTPREPQALSNERAVSLSYCFHWSERGDLNSRPPVPQTGSPSSSRQSNLGSV